ncbi:MAG: tRNA (N6-isopentenyl adenosine(37)-C2)-methylthiotransferase MiaB [Candidatus Eisenbacteria bacterium]
MKVYLETYGCQMNLSDSEIVGGLLAGEGFEVVEDLSEADGILINTCAVREHAEERIFRRLRELRPLKEERPALRIGVLGCLAQSLKADLLEHSDAVDFIVGPDAYRSLPGLLRRTADRAGVRETRLSKTETYTDLPPMRRSIVNAWVTVMRGCDNFCTFCVVPYTRGRERSRPADAVLAEARAVAREGVPQITLLGQNVNSYRDGGLAFADLLRAVSRAEGIRRVRFISPHPKDFPDDLLRVIAQEPAAMPHVHLPLQSGSDRVLERMNRGYTYGHFARLVDRIRDAIPGVSITTDLIAGFPGETDEDFERTAGAMEEIRFHSAFTFPYSERRHTLAARRFADDVPREVKSDRVTRLVRLERAHSRERLDEEVGEVVEVLVEGASKKSEAEAFGRTPKGSGVVFPADRVRPGEIRNVLVVRATTHTLIGRPDGAGEPPG